MPEGWIKIHRKMVEWEWYNDSKTLHLFIHLLLNANHADNKWQGKMIKRGQLITGRDKIKSITGISIQSIRTSFEKLKSSKEITIKSTNKYSLITILNYDYYQGDKPTNQQTNQQLTSQQPTTNQQLTTNKNDKKEKNVKNEKEIIEIDFKSEIKNELLEYFEYLKKDHNRSIGHMQIEQASRLLDSWYKSNEDKIQCLSRNILGKWKNLTFVEPAKMQSTQPKSKIHKDLSYAGNEGK